MEVPQADADRSMLATILLKEDEELNAPSCWTAPCARSRRFTSSAASNKFVAELRSLKETTAMTSATSSCANWSA